MATDCAKYRQASAIFQVRTMRRRHFLQLASKFGLVGLLAPPTLLAQPKPRQRAIPSSGEWLPLIGMGSWQTFDVFDEHYSRPQRLQVMERFFAHGGGLIDASPMYGSSEKMIGYCLEQLQNTGGLFSATKVWTYGRQRGIRQMEQSRKFWGIARFDLMQIHNLLDWETQLETLRQWKAEGRIRYIGITTSHGRRHDELEHILRSQDLDFVQFTYNLIDREAEQRLLPLAVERKIAVIINRPFQGGNLFSRVRGEALPPWAAEFDCANWAQFFLKFIIAHPAVTCAIPATSKPAHMDENMGAGHGRLPDEVMRQRMVRYLQSL